MFNRKLTGSSAMLIIVMYLLWIMAFTVMPVITYVALVLLFVTITLKNKQVLFGREDV